jgi:hypothetical protein
MKKCKTCNKEIESRHAKSYCSQECFHSRNGTTYRKCKTCDTKKTLSEFDKNKHLPLGHGYTCKSCRSSKGKEKWRTDDSFREHSKKYLQEYRVENKERINELNRKNSKKCKKRNYEFISEIKKGGCSECGYDKHPSALQFHHVDPSTKSDTVGFLTHKPASLDRLKEEIDKCILLCANCHAEHHNDHIGIK